LIYEPALTKVLSFIETNLAAFVENRLSELKPLRYLQIQNQTPLRIRRNRDLLKNISFADFFKQCSLRLKFLSENYGQPLDFDYQSLMKKAESVQTESDNLWRHGLSRRSKSQNKKFELDGMLGEIKFQSDDFSPFLSFIAACEFLNIGSASSLGLGKFRIEMLD
jgi:hypothetical protein